MIIEFAAANFRSIRERQTLSMVAASRDASLPKNVIDISIPGLSNTKLLKSAVLYGPNASGKSNLLKALEFMDSFVENSATSIKPDDPTGVEPFRLDLESRNKPSEFEITFVMDEIRYQFGFIVDSKRVHEEWLYAYPKGKPQLWYKRTFDSATNIYAWEFSQKHFKGDKESLKGQTRLNALFLSTGAQFNHEQLLPIYTWFRERLWHLDLGERSPSHDLFSTAGLMMDDDSMRKKVSKLLQSADLKICDIRLRDGKPLEEWLSELREKSDLSDGIKKIAEAVVEFSRRDADGMKRPPDIMWLHTIAGSAETEAFDSTHQSAGTLRYFSLLGPWLKALEKGPTLFVDELGANIHPLLVRGLLKMLASPTENPAGAQVIFTTHDVTLLDKDIFRRDQIWLTEKDEAGATRLYPLTDYQPRKDESLAKGYLAGRYGAVPFLRGELAL